MSFAKTYDKKTLTSNKYLSNLNEFYFDHTQSGQTRKKNTIPNSAYVPYLKHHLQGG